MSPRGRPGALPSEQSFDWSQWYVEDIYVAESCEQGAIIDELRSSLRELARQRGWKRCFIGWDNYFAWVRSEPLVRVSPDVYLVDVTPPDPLPTSWQTWRRGHKPPRWAMEIVSSDWRKDYRENPLKYAQLGCSELVLFDPELVIRGGEEGGERAAFTVFRRGAEDALERVYSGVGPAYSRELDAWLIATRLGYSARARVALDERGTQIVPTEQEAGRQRAEAERQRAEAERQRAEAERQRAEATKQQVSAEKRRADLARRRANAQKKRADRAEARERALRDRLRRAGLDPDGEPE